MLQPRSVPPAFARGRSTTSRPAVAKPLPPGAPARTLARVVPPARRLVRDLMTETVYTLTPSDDLATLYDLMDFRRVRHVPIQRDGELVGLVTSADLSRSALGQVEDLPLSAERERMQRRRVRDIMSTEPETIGPDSPLKEAAEMLLENKIGCLPVVEGLRLVGILTEADFVSDFLEREEGD